MIIVMAATAAIVSLLGFVLARALRRRNVLPWLLNYLRGGWSSTAPHGVTRHLMFCFVDHFEPGYGQPDEATERARVARWREGYPRLCDGHQDFDGRAPIHTFFFPEEEYRPEHIDALVELCKMGLAEIEIHLHHDNDTEAGLREKLRRFCARLVGTHGALPLDAATGKARWAFIHGNWALDNSRPDGRWCGVNNELRVLRDEGCYADFTFPAAPDPCQPSTINMIYYATDDPGRPKSFDTGSRVRVGGRELGDLMLIQGPLGFMWRQRKFGLLPPIENSDVRTTKRADPRRIDAWVRTGIHVEGRPEWIFVKVHTHGAPERDVGFLLGDDMKRAFQYLESRYNDGEQWCLHYVSAREVYNIVKAAEAGRSGNPGDYRDFAIPRPTYHPRG